MPAYIVEPTTSQGPETGQANQKQVTIPVLTPSIPGYSFGRAQGYNDAPNQGADVGDAFAVAKGRQFAIRAGFSAQSQNSPAIGIELTTPSAPTTFSVTIEGAFNDLDSEYFPLPAESPDFTPNPLTAVGKFTFPLGHTRVNFIRANCTAFTGGTSPTLVVKFVV